MAIGDHRVDINATRLDQLRGLTQIYSDRFFWGIAPLGALSAGGSMAIVGLWAGPWLRDVAGMGGFTIVLVIMATGWITGPGLWLLLAAVGFFSAAASLNYAIVSQHFPRDLAGRANTAHNVLVFITPFIVQWGIGGILRAWEDTTTHQYDSAGYQVAFGITAMLQAFALVWFLRNWMIRSDTLESRAHIEAYDIEAPTQEPVSADPRERF